jgi:small subunit ribosomal protein S20
MGGEDLAAAPFSSFAGEDRRRPALRFPEGLANMANTTSARKAARKIARRTTVNKARRSQLRTSIGKVEEAIAAGDRALALAALKEAEPVLMRAAQKGVVHRNAASRKVSRMTDRVAKLAH